MHVGCKSTTEKKWNKWWRKFVAKKGKFVTKIFNDGINDGTNSVKKKVVLLKFNDKIYISSQSVNDFYTSLTMKKSSLKCSKNKSSKFRNFVAVYEQFRSIVVCDEYMLIAVCDRFRYRCLWWIYTHHYLKQIEICCYLRQIHIRRHL